MVDVDGLRMREGGGTETDRPLSEGQKERTHHRSGLLGAVIHQKDEEARMEGGAELIHL